MPVNNAVQAGIRAYLAGRQAAQSRLEQQQQLQELESRRQQMEQMKQLFPVQLQNTQLAGQSELAGLLRQSGAGGDISLPGTNEAGQARTVHIPSFQELSSQTQPAMGQLGNLTPEESALLAQARMEDRQTGKLDATRRALNAILVQRNTFSRIKPTGDMVPDPDPESLTGVKKVYYGPTGEVVREVKNLLVPGMQPKITSGTRTVTDEFGNTTVQRTTSQTQTVSPGASVINPSPTPRRTPQAPGPASAPQPKSPGAPLTPNPRLDPFVDAISQGKMTLQQVPQGARAAVISRAAERKVDLPGLPSTKSGSQAGLAATQISIDQLNSALDKADWSFGQRQLLASALTIQGDNVFTANLRGAALSQLTPENLQVENWVRSIREDAASLRQYLGNPPVRSDKQFQVILAVVPSASDILAGKDVAKTRLANFARVVNGIKAAIKPGARPEDGLIDPSKVPPDIRKQAGIPVTPQEEADWYLNHPK